MCSVYLYSSQAQFLSGGAWSEQTVGHCNVCRAQLCLSPGELLPAATVWAISCDWVVILSLEPITVVSSVKCVYYSFVLSDTPMKNIHINNLFIFVSIKALNIIFVSRNALAIALMRMRIISVAATPSNVCCALIRRRGPTLKWTRSCLEARTRSPLFLTVF